jgi:hypothetical protein
MSFYQLALRVPEAFVAGLSCCPVQGKCAGVQVCRMPSSRLMPSMVVGLMLIVGRRASRKVSGTSSPDRGHGDSCGGMVAGYFQAPYLAL